MVRGERAVSGFLSPREGESCMEKNFKILIVDDERTNIDVLAELLRPTYRVQAAINGQQALKVVRGTSPPDLILLDIIMPEMDGYAVCRELKADPVTSEIPIIFVTAMGQVSDEAKGLECGAVDYITKPISSAIVEARIKTQLTLKQNMMALREAYRLIDAQKDRMQQELSVGKDIQLGMLPSEAPDFNQRPEFSICASLTPAREVGGDFYDFYFIDEDELCVCVGDVSGKGVPAALFMAVTKTLIKATAAGDSSPASIITQVNDEISRENPSFMFVTIFVGVLNLKSGSFTYTNAGHNPPFIKRTSGETELLRDCHGPVIGAMEGLAYQESVCQLRRGDLLMLYTDGVTEAIDQSGNLFSEARLSDLVRSGAERSVEPMLNLVRHSVDQFAEGAEQADDITLLCLTFDKDPEEASGHTLALQLKNSIDEIGRGTGQFEEFARQHDVPKDLVSKMNVALDELLSNIVKYAYPDAGEYLTEVTLDFDAVRLKAVISDGGIPFNPFNQERPDTTQGVDDREIGGLGIHLVKTMFDEVRYQRRAGRNIVTLVKRIQKD